MKLIYLAEGGSLLCPLASQEFLVACDRIACRALFGFLGLRPKPLLIREKVPSSYTTLLIRVSLTVWHQRQTISALAVNHRLTLQQQNSHSDFHLGSGLDLVPKQRSLNLQLAADQAITRHLTEHSIVLSGQIDALSGQIDAGLKTPM